MFKPMPTFSIVVPNDFDAMVALRIDALRESLERLGRFDPNRARERLASGFAPKYMQHIELEGQRVGFMTLRPDAEVFKLDHLYVLLSMQSRGIGDWALQHAKAQATAKQCDITLSALQQSDANRFYLRHGFVKIGESEFDIDYRWYVNGKVSA